MKAIRTAKQAFESGKITKIIQGHNGKVRVDARVRNFNQYPDMDRFYSEWITRKYANKLCMENYGKKVNEMNIYEY